MIAGRVIRVDGARIRVVDVCASVDLVLVGGDDVRVGDLVRCEGPLDAARVIEAQRPAAFARAGGDVARVLFGGAGRALVARAAALAATRRWFDSEGFVEVETPVVVPSPGLDVHLAAIACDGGYLVTSPEYQMKRLVAAGLPRVFQLARCFRSGEIGERHNPEFTMLEWYRAFAGYEAMMRDTEEIVRVVVGALGGGAQIVRDGRAIDLSKPFARLSVVDAFRRFAGASTEETLLLASTDEDAYFRVLVERVEPAIAALDTPVFLVDYPVSQASLARKKPDDPRVAERFELYVAGVELCNGFGELTDPIEQRARLDADRAERARRGLPVYPVDERFLAALEEGLPPCAGNALGFDRLVMLALGARSLADVQAFAVGNL